MKKLLRKILCFVGIHAYVKTEHSARYAKDILGSQGFCLQFWDETTCKHCGKSK